MAKIAIVGLLFSLACWLGNGSGENLGVPGVQVPGWLRRVARRDPGPVYIHLFAFELWAIGLVVLGVIGFAQERLLGSTNMPAAEWFLYGIWVPGIIFVGTLVAGFLRKRQT